MRSSGFWAAFCLSLVLTLTACAGSLGPSGRDESRGVAYTDATWVVLTPFDRRGRSLASNSARVLIETHLRARGVSRLSAVRSPASAFGSESRRSVPPLAAATPSKDSSDNPSGRELFVSELADAKNAGRRYAVAVTLLDWTDGRRPGDRIRVSLDAEVHDLVSGQVILDERVTRTARSGRSLTATADRAIRSVFSSLKLATRGPDSQGRSGQDNLTTPATTPAAGSSVAPGLVTSDTDRALGLSLRAALPAPSVDAATVAALDGRATAFFYGRDLPIASLAQFDRVVLEPDNTRVDELRQLAARSAATFAYLSVGEVGPGRAWRDQIDDAWVIGRNTAWNSEVMDLASDWTRFLDQRVDALVAKGFSGLFLDTMDSHVVFAASPDARARQARGLSDFIQRARQRHPSLRIIANRGFEVLDAIGSQIEAVAAESLYARWDNTTAQYTDVPASDREWLLGQLQNARLRHGVDIISIDYLPANDRPAARAVAAQIAQHGFVPWVATPELDTIGVGSIDVLPREVLMLFDSVHNAALANAEVHRLLATPLEYLGLVPVYHDLATQGLPPANLGNRYAGITHWSRGALAADVQAWFSEQVEDGVPLALFGSQWIAPGSLLAKQTGLAIDSTLQADTTRVRTRDELIGFEQEPPRRFEAFGQQARSIGATNTVHLGVEDKKGEQADLIVTGPWGGFAAQPAVMIYDLDQNANWILDPYAFLSRSFDLPAAPMPDVTSEAGKRLWLAHIDGDALPSWSELPGRRLGAEVVRDRILDRWPLPHTISVVEAEMTEFPAYRDRLDRMYAVARDMLARPYVEIASHTYSHPFRWADLAASPTSGKHNLDVGDYIYSPTREIAGSAAFIDRELAPPGKRTEVLLWSGDALPNEADIAAADDAGLLNMNGGFTTINRAQPWLSLVTPMARTVGERLQVYAPIMNENVYTNDWLGPFDGFRRVIETFEMTDKPRRLKPINIYYHFYIGTKAAGIRSLEEIYKWSVAQDVQPVDVGDYAERVRVYREAGLARRLDGSWQLDGLQGLSSVRVVGTDASLDGASQAGVSSSIQLHDGLYLGTDGRDRLHLALKDSAERRRAVRARSLSTAERR